MLAGVIVNYIEEFILMSGFGSVMLLLNYVKLKKVNIKLNKLFMDIINLVFVTLFAHLFFEFLSSKSIVLIFLNCSFDKVLLLAILTFLIGIFYFSRDYFYEEKIVVLDVLLVVLLNLIIITNMLKSESFLVFFLLLEVQNIIFFVLYNYFVNWWYTHEASFRYYLISAFASTIILVVLFGFWGLYGTWDLLNYASLIEVANNALVQFLLTLFLFAFFIKLGVFPFQLWIVEVYQGLSYPLVFYFFIVPKLVFFFFLVKFYFLVYMFSFVTFKVYFFIFLIGSMVWGMLRVMLQFSLIKFLVYSSMFNISFFLASLFFVTYESIYISFFFLITYLLNFFFFFSVVLQLKDLRTWRPFLKLEEFVSLNNIYVIIVLFLFVLSLAGIPPFLGFFGKFFVLWEMVLEGAYLLFAIFLLLSLLAIYYYIRFTRFFVFPGYKSYQMLKVINYKYAYMFSLFVVVQIFSFLVFIDYGLLILNFII